MHVFSDCVEIPGKRANPKFRLNQKLAAVTSFNGLVASHCLP